MKAIIALAVLVALTGPALAQQRTLYDASGRVIGKSATDSQSSRTLYDASGRVIGRTSTDSQGTTTIYDGSGRVIGKTTK